MMGYKQWCNNRYYSSKVIEVLSQMIGCEKNKSCVMSQLFYSSKVCKEHIMSSLLQVFIETEKTSEGHHHPH